MVHLLDEPVITPILFQGTSQSWNRDISGVDYRQDPHAVQKLYFLDKTFEEQPEQIVVMPCPNGWPHDRMNQVQFIGGRDLVYVLVVIAQNIFGGCQAIEP